MDRAFHRAAQAFEVGLVVLIIQKPLLILVVHVIHADLDAYVGAA